MRLYALVVDDVRIAADAIARGLELLGYEAAIAYGPRPAIESLNRRVPDVILLDINMPGVDGVEVCRYLRREPRTAGVPIIAVSSEVQPETIKRVRQAGANAFLSKPLDLDALEKALRRLFAS
jgi:two-component system cell cycle response regulator